MPTNLQPVANQPVPSTRLAFVREARSCVGTPYADMGRLKGVGLDCIGAAIWAAKEVGVMPPSFNDTPYGPVPDGMMVKQLQNNLQVIWEKGPNEKRAFQPLLRNGDLASFAWKREPQHIAIIVIRTQGEGQGWNMIHAWDGCDKVVEAIMDAPWVHRCRGIYRIKGLT